MAFGGLFRESERRKQIIRFAFIDWQKLRPDSLCSFQMWDGISSCFCRMASVFCAFINHTWVISRKVAFLDLWFLCVINPSLLRVMNGFVWTLPDYDFYRLKGDREYIYSECIYDSAAAAKQVTNRVFFGCFSRSCDRHLFWFTQSIVFTCQRRKEEHNMPLLLLATT